MLYHFLLKTLQRLLMLLQWKPKSFQLFWPSTICTHPVTSKRVSYCSAPCSFCASHTGLLSIPLLNQVIPNLLLLGTAHSSLWSTWAFLPRLQGPDFNIIVAPFPALFYPKRIFWKVLLQCFLWCPWGSWRKTLKRLCMPQFLPPSMASTFSHYSTQPPPNLPTRVPLSLPQLGQCS